jgi:archaellum biogenesis ATPase FlaH
MTDRRPEEKNEAEAVDSVKLLTVIFRNCDGGLINIRILPEGENIFVKLDEVEKIPGLIKKYQASNVYFGVASRSSEDGTKRGIFQIPALFTDIDLNGTAPQAALDRLSEFPLKPSAIIETGGGFHVYWVLKEPATSQQIPEVESYLRRLVRYVGGDKLATDASRILRIPGTLNQKRKKFEVKLKELHPDLEYNLSDFDILAPLPQEEARASNPDWKNEIFEGVGEGERNTALTRLAGRYVSKGLNKEEILPILLHANSAFKPPLPLREVETILDSVIKTHQRKHPELLEKKAPVTEDPLAIPNLPTLSEICSMDVSVEYVIEGLIPRQSVTVIHGKGGVGKTWLALQMGYCIAEGLSFLGLETEKQPVYYIDFENSLATLHHRGIILGEGSMKIWHLSNQTPPPRLDSDEWIKYKHLPPGVIFFDTLRSCQLMEENSSKDMAIIMGRLKELREIGFTVILLHHSLKSDARTYKGSTAIQDLCDHVLSLVRVKGIDNDKEADDDDLGCPYRLGVAGKTRYEPFSIFLHFDPLNVFELADDPEEKLLLEIHSAINELEKKNGTAPNQSQIVEFLSSTMDRKRVLHLLKKGEGKFWNSFKMAKRKAVFYEALADPVCSGSLLSHCSTSKEVRTNGTNKDSQGSSYVFGTPVSIPGTPFQLVPVELLESNQ